jgi:hypothetical protein
MNAPPLLGSEREENEDGLNASHGHERIIVVDPLLLDEATCNEPRLVLDHLPDLVLLELEYPLQSDRTVASRQVDEVPRTIGKVEECNMESQHLQNCSPCLYRLRTDELAHE